MAHPRAHRINLWSALLLFALISLDVALWYEMVGGKGIATGIHALHVTKGSAALIVTPDGAAVLNGAGSDAGVVSELAKALPSGKWRIDLAIIPAPDENTYGGFAYVLQHYSIGTFLYNGRNDINHKADWKALLAQINQKHIPMVTIGAGDKIHFGQSAVLEVLSPDVGSVQSANASDTRISTRFLWRR